MITKLLSKVLFSGLVFIVFSAMTSMIFGKHLKEGKCFDGQEILDTWPAMNEIGVVKMANLDVDTQLILADNGKSKYTIILPEKATITEMHAGKVLQDYLRRISGVSLPLAYDNELPQAHEILVGKVNRDELKNVDYEVLKEDGLLIKTERKKLILTGGHKKGVLYSVYTFLDEYLGCRKYSSDASYVPQKTKIKLSTIDDQQLPSFAFRETHYQDAFDEEYMDWHKLHTVYGSGGNKTQWGYFVHTFHTLLNPKVYGETHPEYFSFYNGKRHAGLVPSFDGKGMQPESQLCLTNPDVLEIVCKNLQIAMDSKPEALYWSVSQNDNINYCRCEKCAALDRQYAAFNPEEKMFPDGVGGTYSALGMGSLLTFVNQVAARFPDKIISTLAYQYSRVPPKGIMPRKNVNIMLCSFESTRNDPIELGDKSFAEDLIGWGKLTDNIFVWDYAIRFSHLLAPFPNLKVLQPNLQFLHRNNVSAVFVQGNRDKGGEFAELRAYLISRMLWNINVDAIKEMNDFLVGYYGAAAKDVKSYIELLHSHNQAGKGIEMSIFGSPANEKETFLSASLLNQYKEIFDRALEKVSNQPQYYLRVRTARLPVYYALLEIAKAERIGKCGAFNVIDNQLVPKPEIVEILQEFSDVCKQAKVSRIAEWHTTPSEYTQKYLSFLDGNE